MTLSSRVRLAEAEGTAIRARDDGWMLDELKEDVGRIIPGDVLARLADENPRRARSELQSACKQAFASPRWAGRSNELKTRLSRDLEDIVFGMGPLQALVEDPTITEVMVNGTSSLFIERSGLLVREAAVFSDEAQVRALIDRILAPLGRRVDESSPMVDARLPGGHRVNVVIPPIPLRILKTRPEFSEKSMGAFALPAKSSTNRGKAFSQVASCFASGLRTCRISEFNCNRISGMETQFFAKPVFGIPPVHTGALFRKSNSRLAEAAW